MVHTRRRHSICRCENLDELVEKLLEHVWTGCSAFAWESLVLRNDSFSPDGAQEYAVFIGEEQAESLTVSWMSPEDLKRVLQELASDPSRSMHMGHWTFDPHGPESCGHCA